MADATCFDPPTLQDYLLGKLPDEQSDLIASHLERCLNCEATISQLDRASDTLTDGLRLPVAPPQSADRSSNVSLRRALEHVESLGGFPESPSVSERSNESINSPAIGGLVLRDYRLLEPIGSGGMGTVYKAVHSRLDRLVAVKLLPARRLGNEQAVSRFQREMRVIGQLSHPAIVQATDAGEVDGTHFLVMEYVEGFDLNHIARAVGTLTIPDACEIARQAALGLEYAHQQGIVHRDIKPSNLMLSRESRVQRREQDSTAVHSQLSSLDSRLSIKILDLGLALLSGEQAPVDELTTVGQLMGTLDYMAPEQIEDSHLVGPRADIYALAATLFRLLTGSAPFAKDDRKTPLQKLRALATQSAPPIRDRRSDIPADLAAIIDRALSRELNNRPQSMSDLAAALAPWCATHDLAALARRASESRIETGKIDRGVIEKGEPGCVSPQTGVNVTSADPIVRGLTHPGSPDFVASSTARSDLPRADKRRNWKLLTATLLLFAILAAVITIQTNKGQLVIETAREGIEVRIKQSGRIVDEFGVTKWGKTTRLEAGEYEIEFVGPADGLTIDKKQFVLKRGEAVVARVTEVPQVETALKSDPKPEPPGIGAGSQPHADPTQRLIKPEDIVDRNAKGMESFEAANPDWQAEKKVRELLLKKIDVPFIDTPLTEAVKWLEEQAGVVMLLDAEALKEESISQDSTITRQLSDVSIATAMHFSLSPLKLTWIVDAEQVLITTEAKASEHLITRTYPVGKLLPGVRLALPRLQKLALEQLQRQGQGGGGGFGGGGQAGGGFFDVPSELFSQPMTIRRQFGGGGGNQAIIDEQTHFAGLLQTLSGTSWEVNGDGAGNSNYIRNVLSVRQTEQAHLQIESLLRAVEVAFLQPLKEPVAIRPLGYPHAVDARIREQLIKPHDADFIDIPLTEALNHLAEQMQLSVVIDEVALKDEEIPLDRTITLNLKNVPAAVLLRRLLQPLSLRYEIEQGVLVITTATKASERLVTTLYDIRNLVSRGLTPELIVTGIENGTRPDTWSSQGGAGSAFNFADTLLVVTQTSPVQTEVAKFLTSLHTQFHDQPEVPRVATTPAKQPTFNLQEILNQPPAGGSLTKTEPTTKTDPPKPPSKTNTNNQPRYDGKSFDEWLQTLDTERSPAKLAEALQALKLLMHEGQADQVAEVVLRLLRAIDPKEDWGPARRALFHDLQPLFKQLPKECVAKAVAKELRAGNARSRMAIFEYAMGRNGPHGAFWKFEGQSEAPPSSISVDVAKAVLDLTQERNTEVRAESIWWLALLPRPESDAVLGKPLASAIDNLLVATLDDSSPVIAMAGTRGLWNSPNNQPAVANTLRKLLAPKNVMHLRWGNSPVFASALDVACRMGPSASLAAPEVAKYLDESIVSWDAVSKSSGRSDFPPSLPKQLALRALARMGKSAAHALPNITAALAVPDNSDAESFWSLSPSVLKEYLKTDDPFSQNQKNLPRRMTQEFESPLSLENSRDIQRALELRLSGKDLPTDRIDLQAADAVDQILARLLTHKLLHFELRHTYGLDDPTRIQAERESLQKKMKVIEANPDFSLRI